MSKKIEQALKNLAEAVTEETIETVNAVKLQAEMMLKEQAAEQFVKGLFSKMNNYPKQEVNFEDIFGKWFFKDIKSETQPEVSEPVTPETSEDKPLEFGEAAAHNIMGLWRKGTDVATLAIIMNVDEKKLVEWIHTQQKNKL